MNGVGVPDLVHPIYLSSITLRRSAFGFSLMPFYVPSYFLDRWNMNYLEKASGEPDIEVIRIAHEIQNGKPVVATLRRQMPLSELSKLQRALEQIRN
jgi:hypothetical protein